jgi:Fic family protein
MFGTLIKNHRLQKNFSLKDLAQHMAIDPSLLSRIENGQRTATETQVKELAQIFNEDGNTFLKSWLADKVFGILRPYPSLAEDVMLVMESRAEYLTGPKALETTEVTTALQEQLGRIDALRKNWGAKQPSAGLQLEKMNESFAVEYTYESNRIEGNTLSMQETYLVVHQGLTIGGKSVQEHLEAINHDEAIEFVRDLVNNKTEITEYRLKQIHHLVLKGIDRRNAGVYRSVPVRIGGSPHIPPEPFLLNKLMEDLFRFYEAEKFRMHPVLLAAEMHERLVTIHPFIDGNGRTARLLMNLILLRNGYTLAILKGSDENRLAYYQALQAVQTDANPEPFYTLIASAVEEGLNNHLRLV